MTAPTTDIVPVVKALPAGPSRPFVEQIRLHWRQSFQAVLATGHALVKARQELGDADFKRMIEEELPFGRSTTTELMRIAMDQRIAKFRMYEIWPPSRRTLYELTHIKNDDVFYSVIADGRINPDMTVNDAKHLVKLRGLSGPAVRRQRKKGEGDTPDGKKSTQESPPSDAPIFKSIAKNGDLSITFTAGEFEFIRSLVIEMAATGYGMMERAFLNRWPDDNACQETTPPAPYTLAEKLEVDERILYGLKDGLARLDSGQILEGEFSATESES